MATQTYTFPDHVSGNTFAGTQFQVVVNGAAWNLTGATINAVFTESGSFESHTLSVGTGLTITNGASGIFQVDAQVISWDPDIYNYKITITATRLGTR